jgi:glycosyltransferase involved in cell wall biosynthesis
MKIYIHYDITNKPWGGGNSFLKAFRHYCIKNNIELAKNINDDYDILFFNAASKSKRKAISIDELIKIKTIGVNNKIINKIFPKKKKLLVYRSDGFRDEYADIDDNSGDLIQLLSLQIANHVIFQNKSSLKTASRNRIGYCKNNYDIVYNGVNQELFTLKQSFWDGKSNVKVFSANWSNNKNKGYEAIAMFSELKGVDSFFCGNWPSDIDKKNVNVFPPLSQEELSKEYKKYDIFLHPSKYDQSPNVCLEAISCGLPIIYHETSGIKEVAGVCGIEIDELDLENTLESIKKEYKDLILIIKNKRKYYSIERSASEYINIFKNLINKPR